MIVVAPKPLVPSSFQFKLPSIDELRKAPYWDKFLSKLSSIHPSVDLFSRTLVTDSIEMSKLAEWRKFLNILLTHAEALQYSFPNPTNASRDGGRFPFTCRLYEEKVDDNNFKVTFQFDSETTYSFSLNKYVPPKTQVISSLQLKLTKDHLNTFFQDMQTTIVANDAKKTATLRQNVHSMLTETGFDVPAIDTFDMFKELEKIAETYKKLKNDYVKDKKFGEIVLKQGIVLLPASPNHASQAKLSLVESVSTHQYFLEEDNYVGVLNFVNPAIIMRIPNSKYTLIFTTEELKMFHPGSQIKGIDLTAAAAAVSKESSEFLAVVKKRKDIGYSDLWNALFPEDYMVMQQEKAVEKKDTVIHDCRQVGKGN